ncbi:MAG: hypothetical protein IJD01_06575, partial [Clostridia bacterium]|nr:hypothetical protein [Clostridia bacterium]
GEELRVAEQVMYAPQYGEQIGSSATWFRAEPELRWVYLPITEEEARTVEEEFEKTHTPLSIAFTSCSEPMTVDVDGLSELCGRYAVGDGEAQTLEASEADELYRWLLSVPWRQSDTSETDGECAFVRLEFLKGETLSLGEFQLFDDDTLSYRGPQYMPFRWTGQMPEGSYRAVTERRQAEEAPSYEPLSPIRKRLERTDDWQSAGLRAVGLDGVTAQRYKEGAVGTVYLLSRDGIDLDNAAFVPWMAAVETADTVWLVSPSDRLTKPLRIELADMTGDGIEELFVSCDLGGQGGDGAKGAYVYRITDSGTELLFPNPPSIAPSRDFSAQADEEGFVVRHAVTGYEERFEQTSCYEAPVTFEATCAVAEPFDPDGDGVYALYTEMTAYLEFRANTLGYGVAVWKFDGRRLSVKEASFRAERDTEQTVLRTPDWMLFVDYGDLHSEMLVRRGEDGRSFWVDEAGKEGPWRIPLSEEQITYCNLLHEEAHYGEEELVAPYTVLVAHDGYVDAVVYSSQDQANAMISFYEDALWSGRYYATIEELSMSEDEVEAMWPTEAERALRSSAETITVPPFVGDVVLRIPETVTHTTCDGTITVTVTGDRSLTFEGVKSRHVTLTNEQAAYLNACFDAVTDLSASELAETTAGYDLCYHGTVYSFSVPKDYALLRFLRELFTVR